MGIYDRDYAREDESFFSNNLSTKSATTILIGINVGLFLLNALVREFAPADPFFPNSEAGRDILFDAMAAHEYTIVKPWLWWQFLTYGFAHHTKNIMHIAINMLVLYFFGNSVEQRLGKSEFVRFYLLAIVLGGVIWGIKGFLTTQFTGLYSPPAMLVGASGGVQAVTILFAFLFPNTVILLFMIVPVKAWVAGALVAAYNVFNAFFGGASDNTAYDVHLAGIVFAAAYCIGGWHIGRALPKSISDFKLSMPQKRPSLRIHDPGRKRAADDAEADRILEKIHRQGEASLTQRERRFLEAHSKRKREERNQP